MGSFIGVMAWSPRLRKLFLSALESALSGDVHKDTVSKREATNIRLYATSLDPFVCTKGTLVARGNAPRRQMWPSCPLLVFFAHVLHKQGRETGLVGTQFYFRALCSTWWEFEPGTVIRFDRSLLRSMCAHLKLAFWQWYGQKGHLSLLKKTTVACTLFCRGTGEQEHFLLSSFLCPSAAWDLNSRMLG